MNTITTFDGKFWNKQELLTKMNDDDFYFNYLGKNVLSSSSCSYLLNSPKNYKDKLVAEFNKPSPQQRIGSLVHYRILEPEKWDKIHFVDTKSVANKIYKEALNTHKLVYLKQEKDLYRPSYFTGQLRGDGECDCEFGVSNNKTPCGGDSGWNNECSSCQPGYQLIYEGGIYKCVKDGCSSVGYEANEVLSPEPEICFQSNASNIFTPEQAAEIATLK